MMGAATRKALQMGLGFKGTVFEVQCWFACAYKHLLWLTGTYMCANLTS